MNDDRNRTPGMEGASPGQPGSGAADDALAGDFRALRARSARDLPTVHQTALTARSGHERATRGGIVMSMIRSMKTRPMFSSIAIGGVVALALLVVPVSYQRTVGQEVVLTLSSPDLDMAVVPKVAKEFGAALGGGAVRVGLEETRDASGAARRAFRLEARVDSRSRGATQRVANAFAAALAERGIVASVAVTSLTERVSGNVYAAAGNSIINLTIDWRGKTAPEIAASIKSQLEAAGIQNPDVNVTLDGNLTTVQIKADDARGEGAGKDCEIQLRVDGEGAGGVDQVTLHCDPNATCDQIRARIQDELRARGIDADVTVTGQCGGGTCSGTCEVEVRVERRR